jgi:hypothetical protein
MSSSTVIASLSDEQREKLSQLTAMGFDSDTSLFALEHSRWVVDAALDAVLRGNLGVVFENSGDRVIPLEFSQYNMVDGSTSACTSIAYSFVATGLELLGAGEDFENTQVLTEVMLEGVAMYDEIKQTSPSLADHLAVEDVIAKNKKHTSVQLVHGPEQACTNSDIAFETFLRSVYSKVSNKTRPVGIVITKPPESVAVILPSAEAHSSGRGGGYYLFDSHSRLQQGLSGAYLVESRTIEALAQRLNLTFPFVDSSGDDTMDLMYNCFDASVFQFNK